MRVTYAALGLALLSFWAGSGGCGSVTPTAVTPDGSGDMNPGSGGSGPGSGGSGSGGGNGSGGSVTGSGGDNGSGGSSGGTGGTTGASGGQSGSGGTVGSGGAFDARMDSPPDMGTDTGPDTAPCTCPGTLNPVCGVDGKTYSNACQADCAGVAIAHTGACDAECMANGDCMLWPEAGNDCCGVCQPKTSPKPPMVFCLIACRNPVISCTCVLGKCTGRRNDAGAMMSQ